MAYKRISPAPIVEGGTGVQSNTAYAVITGGTTSTGAQQNVSGVGTSGQLLTSNGAGQLPSWMDPALGLIICDSGVVGADTITLTGSTFGTSFSGSVATMTDSFNYLAIPTTSSTNGQVTINGNRYLHGYGTNNTFIGNLAGNFTLSGNTNVGIGSNAMNAISSASSDTFIGYQAGGTGTITGTGGLVGIGYQALKSATSCPDTVAIGANALQDTTTGSATHGSVAIGSQAGIHVQGIDNAIVGYNSMSGTGITGNTNTAIGSTTLTSITSGSNNAVFGYSAGSSYTGTEASNILINNTGTVGDSNTCRIGAGTGTGTQQLNQTFVHGIRGTTTVNNNAIAVLIDSAGQLGTTSSSIRYKENIADMHDASSPILNLRPVTFDFKNKPNHRKSIGLIAEEVERILPSLVAYNQDGEIESVKYHDISVLLLNEIQRVLSRIEYLESKLI